MNVKLVIEVVDGRMGVSGPIHDRPLCYGLLEMAKDLIRQHKPEESVQVPGQDLVNLLAKRAMNGPG